MMDVRKLQTALGVTVDGAFGPKSRAALSQHFTNTKAPAVTGAEIEAFAEKLDCSVAQLRAVAMVESSGAGFDGHGRPKMLFERHLFHRATDGLYSPTVFSQASGGGYDFDSWEKLGLACGKDPDAAFASASWGRFQVLGVHWSKLAYESPYALAHSCVASEAAHFDLLTRFVQTFGLTAALRKISPDPEDCRDFAKLYNGAGYQRFNYHTKLAGAMR